MELIVEHPNHEGQLDRILEGPVATFPGNTTLMDFFQHRLKSGQIDPQNSAIFEEETRCTFQELDELSTSYACVLKILFFKEGLTNKNPDQDLVIGVCIPPSDKLVITLFAIEKLGAAYLPYEDSFPETRIIKMTKDARPVMIISDNHSNFELVKDITKVFTTAELAKLILEGGKSDLESKIIPLPSFCFPPEKTALIMYTSGSSGEPKGVRLSHRNIMNRLHWGWQNFPFKQDERCVLKTSLTFGDSIVEIFGPLLQGVSLTVMPKNCVSSTDIFIQKLGQFKITRLVLVPSLLRAIFQTMKLVDDAAASLETVKLWVCSGEVMPKDLLTAFFEHFPKGYTICNFYGSTELTADVAFVSFISKEDICLKTLENHVPIGLPINNTVLYILNEKCEMSPAGETGGIYVGGYNIFKGYVGKSGHLSTISNPFSNSPGFDRLYNTGDFGRLTKTPGSQTPTLIYEGRMDSQIKVRGHRVDLAEIEMVMSKSELISNVKVLCYHSGFKDQAIVAFFVSANLNDAHIGKIKALVDINLRNYERPVLWKMETIPLLVNGKTDGQRLLKIYEEYLQNRTTFVDWNSLDLSKEKLEIIKIVLTTMSEITGTAVEEIAGNLNNSFYNVGGSSLNSIKVIVKLRERKCFITIPDFLGAKTIKEIIQATTEMDNEVPTKEKHFDGLYVFDEGKATYSTNYLTEEDKADVCHMISTGFPGRNIEVESIWEPLLEQGLSFIMRQKSNEKAMAVTLNFDINDEPPELQKGPRGHFLELLELIESRQREKLPKEKGKLIHSFMMATAKDNKSSENVMVIKCMEEKVIKMATEKNFLGIMATNTSVLTQDHANKA